MICREDTYEASFPCENGVQKKKGYLLLHGRYLRLRGSLCLSAALVLGSTLIAACATLPALCAQHSRSSAAVLGVLGHRH